MITSDQIKEIQSTGIDYLGNPLKVDGNAGPKTLWWMGILTLCPPRQQVLKVALGYHAMGMREDNTNSIANDGTFVDMLLKPVGLKNQPWCLAFCSHVYRKVGVQWPSYITGAKQVIDLVKSGKQAKFVDQPKPGDLEVFLYQTAEGDTKVQGHGRIVTAFDPKTGITLGVDGNVGDAVRVGYRRPRPERYFIRPSFLDEPELTMPSGLMYLDNLVTR